jgi:hypothetical protein
MGSRLAGLLENFMFTFREPEDLSLLDEGANGTMREIDDQFPFMRA